MDQDCDGYADAGDTTCTSSFALAFPDGATASFDGCVERSMTAGDEFDPDAPPEIITPSLARSAWGDEGFQCTVAITAGPVCTEGYYTVEDGAGIGWAAFDCSGVADEDELEAVAFAGWVAFTEVDTGSAVGNLSGRPVRTALAGTVHGVAASGAALAGSFAVAAEQIAADEDAPGACLAIDGDVDGDGWITDAFGGGGGDSDDADAASTVVAEDADCDGARIADDCDDADAAVNPSAAEICGDGVDNDCDGRPGACPASSGDLEDYARWIGESDEDFVGTSVAMAGDVDNDGYDDFLVGAPVAAVVGTSSGATYLVRGGASPASASLSSAVRYTGTSAWQEAGTSVAGAGDVNGDGYDDVVIGGQDWWFHTPTGGYAWLVLGSAAPTSASLSTAVAYTGRSTEDAAGTDVAGVGDVNADGFDDLLVGAPCNDRAGTVAGAACLVLGRASPASASLSTATALLGERSFDQAGYTVAGAGDVDGDGYDDMLVGAWANSDAGDTAGAAYLLLGDRTIASANLSTATQYTGESPGDAARTAMDGVGDVDGDGYDDFVVGAMNHADGSDYGAVYLVLGRAVPVASSLGGHLVYQGAGNAGYSVSRAGDADDDGHADFIVGAPTVGASTDTGGGGGSDGAAYLVFGSAAPASDTLSSHVAYRGGGLAYAGGAVGGGDDVDGDGYDDLLVSEEQLGDTFAYQGGVYLIVRRGL